jgi:hypothetical protein
LSGRRDEEKSKGGMRAKLGGGEEGQEVGGDLEQKPREVARGCRYPCTWGATILVVWVLGCLFHFIHPLGLPSNAAGASALRLVHLAAAAPRLAVLGRPSAPWPGVPAQRVPQVLVLAPCRARGLCWPPRVPAPATRLGGQAASAWVRASRASAGRWGLLGRRRVWQTASSPSGVHALHATSSFRPTRRGGPAVFIRLCPLSVRLGGVGGVVVSWAVRILGLGILTIAVLFFG